jgi:hypothetical protein
LLVIALQGDALESIMQMDATPSPLHIPLHFWFTPPTKGLAIPLIALRDYDIYTTKYATDDDKKKAAMKQRKNDK